MKKDIATNKRDKADGDELEFKLIVAGLILLIPFIIIYELVGSSWFKCYPRKRKDEYRDMQNRRVTEAGRTKPEFKNFEFCRNRKHLIQHFSSSQTMYPSCVETLYVPDDKVDEFAKIPWQKETIATYSVELLSFKEPIHDTEWQFVKYQCCPLGTFTVERNCFDRLTNKSKRKLDKILEGYGV